MWATSKYVYIPTFFSICPLKSTWTLHSVKIHCIPIPVFIFFNNSTNVCWVRMMCQTCTMLDTVAKRIVLISHLVQSWGWNPDHDAKIRAINKSMSRAMEQEAEAQRKVFLLILKTDGAQGKSSEEVMWSQSGRTLGDSQTDKAGSACQEKDTDDAEAGGHREHSICPRSLASVEQSLGRGR